MFLQLGHESVIETLPSCDVLVAGGGPAGVAAAYVAASKGCKVVIVEQYGFLGGAAVAGLSGTFCGLYYGTETGEIREIAMTAVMKKFLAEMERRKGMTKPQQYGKTFTRTHDPLVWSEVAEEMLLSVGVTILYHTHIIDTLQEENEVTGVLLSHKGGFYKLMAKRTVDATGDAEIIYKGRFEYVVGNNGIVQNPTMIFRMSNVDMEEYTAYWGDDTICPEKVTALLTEYNGKDGYVLPRNKIWIFDTPRPGELLVNATMILGSGGENLNSLRLADSTWAEIGGRRQVRSYERFLQEHIPGCRHAYANATATEVGIRQTRTALCERRLEVGDVVSKKKDRDGIARVAWPIELHGGEKPRLEWLIDDYYEIPYQALVPKSAENLIVAGRNVCAEHVALASARVTIPCLQMGEAAGFAAAMSLERDCSFRDIQGRDLHKDMDY